MTAVHDSSPPRTHTGFNSGTMTPNTGTSWQVGLFDRHVARQRQVAERVGWNDAAWGATRRDVDSAMAAWYSQGYAGGLVFRQRQHSDLRAPNLLGAVSLNQPASVTQRRETPNH